MKNLLIDVVIILVMAAVVTALGGLVSNQHYAVIAQFFVTFIGAYTLGYLARGRRKEK